ncbi:MAG: hypothetical protein DHS20C02_15670 [Micavibrio sp.]|nr:MAG: hypothetical protein DHS20C02_15670 [Micavibrio sp.]
MAHLISYDLNKPGQNYDDLYEAIKRLGAWWHYLDSTWIVKSSYSAPEIFEKLKPHIDKNDTVLVIEITSEYSGWLPQKAWDWLREKVREAAYS